MGSASFQGPQQPVALPLSRRRFLRLSGVGLSAAAAGPLLAACGTDGSGQEAPDDGPLVDELEGIDEFVIANWGGTTSEAQLNSWGKLFTERTGIPVRATIMDYARLATMIEEDSVEWDWIDVEGWFPTGRPELFEPLDYDVIGITEDDLVTPDLMFERHVASFIWSYIIGYRTDHEGDHPQTWEQFFDVKGLPGRRSMMNWPYGMLEIALLADGVAFEDLYPLDADRAFDKIDTIRNHLTFWNTGAESQQFLVSEAVDYVCAWDARMNYLARGGLPVAVEWGDNLRAIDAHIIPKNNDARLPACLEFIRAAMDPQAQAEAMFLGGLGPPLKAGFDALDDSVKPLAPSNPDNLEKAVGMIDDTWWAAEFDDMTTKWSEFVGG